MGKGAVRRGQLIAPFGVGALLVVRDGTGVITAGLDHWYERESGVEDLIDPDEFKVEEWRLQRRLGVSHFRLPPDYRRHRSRTARGQEPYNADLTVPFLRFPTWHFCPFCKTLEKTSLVRRDRPTCGECERTRGKKPRLAQVPFVAMCDAGHIQDFPWREWVHKTAAPQCQKSLKLKTTGGTSLGTQKIVCGCEDERSLAGITTAHDEGARTHLTDNLDRQDGVLYPCEGMRPWLGTEVGTVCDRPLRGTLRAASNLYFAHVCSSIFVPVTEDGSVAKAVEIVRNPPYSAIVNVLADLGGAPDVEALRSTGRLPLEPFSDEELFRAMEQVIEARSQSTEPVTVGGDSNDSEIHFRAEEFATLGSERDDPQLRTRPIAIGNFASEIGEYFSKIVLVEKLRETRVLTGFSRVLPEVKTPDSELRSMLWRRDPADWLPASIVHGEGIFFELREDVVSEWSSDVNVQSRIDALSRRYSQARAARGLEPNDVSARLVLVHTLSHLLINQLVFECGYSTASLRERLYVSDVVGESMAGFLVYTASGDSDGTMGGLVRLARPGLLEPILFHALERATWCSSDPVCMEVGAEIGQGPDNCNMAACYGCALVPETTCEQFNKLLDRGAVVGTADSPAIGLFSNLVKASLGAVAGKSDL